jgi:REP element-mobilizing transposase RayT
MQSTLPLRDRPTHGGHRDNSGRKPSGERAGVSHHGRPQVSARTPVHATLRVLDHVWNLRSRRSFDVIEAAIAGMARFRDFRVVHFGVEGNHLHFIVEADHNRALSEGMQGLTIRLAKGLNRMMGSRGRVFADRYHAHVLKTPAEVRNAIAYVLLNHRSHAARRGERVGRGAPDPYSSACTFDGWKDIRVWTTAPRITSPPSSWLLAKGWRLRGLIRIGETPAVRGTDPSPGTGPRLTGAPRVDSA